MTYCEFSIGNPIHGPYHDTEYGFHQTDEDVLFERLILEINQAGLSWETILKKRATFTIAYDNFNVDKVAAYGEADRQRLLADPGIIRNRLKVDAAIHNAQAIQGLRESHGGFSKWLDRHHPLTKEEWVKLFKKTFRFTGGEIVGEFLMSLGYLPGAHHESCPIFAKIEQQGAPWLAERGGSKG